MSLRSCILLLGISVLLFSIGCGWSNDEAGGPGTGAGAGGGAGGLGSTGVLAGTGASISGKVYDNGIVTNILAKVMPQTASGNPVGSAVVYLEEQPEIRTQSSADGSFTLIDIPKNKSVHVIIKYVLGGTTIFRARSEPVFLAGTDLSREISLGVQKADQALTFVLKDAAGNLLPNSTVTIWGENFQADSQGRITVYMPAGTIEAVFSATGYQWQNQTLSFSPTSQTNIELGLASLGSTNRSPQVGLSANSATTVTPRAALSFTAQGSDPDGDFLSYSWTSSLGNLASASVDGTRTTWTAPDYDAVATVSVTVSDGKGAKSTASMRVTIGSPGANRQPVVSIIATASHAIINQTITLAASGTDLDGETLSYAWSADTGTLSSAAGQIVQWQAAGQIGTATISLTGSDGRGGTAVASWQIYIMKEANVTPTVTIQPLTQKVYQGQVVTITAVGADANGDSLNYSWAAGKGTIQSQSSGKADWKAPAEDGSTSVTCTVNDGMGGIASASVIFQVGNFPPQIELVATATTATLSSTLVLTASGTSPVGDTLTYTWTVTSGVLSANTGQNVSWTAPGVEGIATISVLADGGGGRIASATKKFFAGTNQNPTATILASTIAYTGLPVQVTCNATDANKDVLSYYWTATGGSFLDPNQAVATWIAGTNTATYTLTCTVSDIWGGACNSQINIGVLNGRNLAVGEVMHFSVNGQTTIYLSTPTGNENFGVVFYPLNKKAGTYRFEVNGGGAVLPDIPSGPPQNSVAAQLLDARTRVDSILRNKETALANQVKFAKQMPFNGRILASEITPGDVEDFKIYDFVTNSTTSRTFVLKAVGTYCKVFLDSSSVTTSQGKTISPANTSQAMLDNFAAEFDTKIYNFIQNNYGRTWDKNGDGKISIFFSPIVNAGSANGFFDPEDFTDTVNSNQRDCFYTAVYDQDFYNNTAYYSKEITGTLVHEFQHLVNFVEHTHYNVADNEETWLTEGLSVESEMRYTGNRDAFFDYWASAPENVSLANWEQALKNYGGDGLFVRYIYEQLGTGTIKALVQSSHSGVGNIVYRCPTRNGFDGLFMDWAATVFRYGKGLPANPTYDYQLNVGINLNSKTSTRSFGDCFSGSMKSTALRMIKYTPPPGFAQSSTSIGVKDLDSGQLGVTVIRLQ